jgi:hypothetical protein
VLVVVLKAAVPTTDVAGLVDPIIDYLLVFIFFI